MRMKSRAILFAVAVALQFSCKDDGSTSTEILERITLTMIDVGVREAYLHIAVSNPTANETLALQRSGTTVMTFAAVADTNIADTALTQTTTYQYTATLQTANTTTGKSNTLAVQTLAPSSHDWHFTMDSLGVVSSTLYDAAIISDSCAWVVGEMYLPGDPILYNAAQWDGTRWNIMSIPYIYQGSPTYGTIRYLFAFGANDIWFGNSTHWNGQQFHNVSLGGSIFVGIGSNKMWGSATAGELYVVGNNGTIAYSPDRGSTWQRVESGTMVDLLDVWGTPDGSVVWACGYDYQSPRTILLRGVRGIWAIAYDGTASRVQIRPDSLSGAFASVYTPSNTGVLVGSSAGMYLAPQTTRGEAKRFSFTPTFFPGFPNKLRGKGLNDLVIVGDYCFVSHFNGVAWRYFEQLRNDNIRLRSVAQRGSQMFCVGETLDPIYSRGIIIRGIR